MLETATAPSPRWDQVVSKGGQRRGVSEMPPSAVNDEKIGSPASTKAAGSAPSGTTQPATGGEQPKHTGREPVQYTPKEGNAPVQEYTGLGREPGTPAAAATESTITPPAPATSPAQPEEIVIDPEDPRYKIQTKDGLKPVKQVVGENNLVKTQQRKLAKLAPPAAIGKVVERAPLLQQAAALVQQGVPEAEAIERVRVQAQPVPQQTPQPASQPTDDPEPQYPKGFQQGDPEWDEVDRRHLLWQARQDSKAQLAPIVQFIEGLSKSAQAQTQAQAEAQARYAESVKAASTFTSYLPFEYNTLSQEQKTFLNQRINEAASNRVDGGFAFDDAHLAQYEVTPTFVELCTRDAVESLPDDFFPKAALKVEQKPIIPEAPPSPPFMPAATAALPTTAPDHSSPKERRRSSGPSWERKVTGARA